uniref:NADH-ubiquinone oxidoreductase chain 6 n=1 Tax=Cicadetta abscondita TaxID=2593298 RepID=A0A7S6ZPJ3_9HEMI|nr:NADH dehydrogenase subunit 6 [Cicadetta abscondita]QOW07743.1 NADH dehydrogenase subunit 6 [Cicadetta abscondita]
MKIIMYMMIIMSMNFIFMKHPLSMGLILMMQTLLSCLICSFYLSSYLFSYILYLIFIGGMLILFMYMSSIASNEKFFYSIKLMTFNILLMMTMSLLNMIDLKTLNIMNNIMMFMNHDNYMMSKMYIIPSGMMTLVITIYLLFILIIVINILTVNMMTLRSSM